MISREEWLARAIQRYIFHGVTQEKAQLWAEGIVNNDDDWINKDPEKTASDDYFN